jgi:transposase
MKTPAALADFEAVLAAHPALAAWAIETDRAARASREEAALQRERMALLEHELATLKRLLFGARSERFVPGAVEDQLALFDGAVTRGTGVPEARPPATASRSTPRRKPVRGTFPSHLAREVVVIEPDLDTSGLVKIGEEVTETLDYKPARLVVLRRERPKYADPEDESRGVVVAPLPARPVDKGIAEAGLLANVVVEKYVDHLPLYRQAERFRREGIQLSDSTLGGWVGAVGGLLTPLYDALAEEARTSGYIQADETPIAVQDEKKKGATHQGWMWLYHAPEQGLVVMDYRPGRGRDGPRAWLEGYEGLLQTDGYAGYNGIENGKKITRAACWAHARRKFFEAQGSSAEKSGHVLQKIGLLYDVERTLREAKASPGERARVRREEAGPVLEDLKTWLEADRSLPKSPFGKATAYALTRWKELTRYVGEGRLEIDNNLVENQVRPVALGRKNYLFAGSHDAARRSAVIYSMLATCKRHGVNPWAWLSDVLARIPTHPARRVAELLPHRWTMPGGS